MTPTEAVEFIGGKARDVKSKIPVAFYEGNKPRFLWADILKYQEKRIAETAAVKTHGRNMLQQI